MITRAKGIKGYLPEGHTPYARDLKETYFEAMAELPTPPPSVKFGRFQTMNLITGGLRPYEFTILCGATGTGKTTLCANISADLIEQKVPHFVASVETGHTDFVKRVMSAMFRHDLNTGDPVDVTKLKIFHEKHGEVFRNQKIQLSLYDNRTTVESLMYDIAFMVEHHGVKVAIIDNLNFFLEITSAANAIVEMDRVIHELIIFCKNVPVHIIMVMHPKKTDGGRVESEFDIKGSSTAVQEAHNVFLWNRPHPDLLEAGTAIEQERELMIAKMRRKGKYVRRRLLFGSFEGVSYTEGSLV